jgi:tricarballylate dehydrogenase
MFKRSDKKAAQEPSSKGPTGAPHHDVIIIGCGAAGLSAAVSYAKAAKAHGRTPDAVVLERATREGRGGATRWTSSWFRITGDKRLDPNFVSLMEKVSGGLADLAYCRKLEREVAASLDFLDQNGVKWIFFEQAFPNTNTGGGLGMPDGGGVAIVDGLAKVVDATPGVEILYETEAERLITADDGAVTGVVVRGPDGRLKRMMAQTVVIACGGFEGDPEKLTRYVGPRACDMPLIAPTLRNNTGDGLRMAMEVGAGAAGQFDMFHGEPVDTRTDKPDAVIYGYPYGILVNGQCKRFFDEGKDSFDATFEELGFEIWKNQDQEAYFIGDQTTLAIEPFSAIILTDKPPIEADTIPALAEKLGLDPQALEATVNGYNAAVGPGEFNAHIRDGKAALGLTPPKSNWAFPLNSPPFIAYPLTCAITFTFGGVRTDDQGRVLTPSGKVIPGLYAAGEVTGLYYHSYPAGTSVLRSITFGRLAGAAAAERAATAVA